MYVDKAGMIECYGTTKLVQLTDKAMPPVGGIVDAVLDRALADAAAMIHGYARSAGYAVPFSTTAPPDGVTGWQACIALYGLYQGDTPDKVAEDYKTALGQLRDLAAGRFTLQASGVSAPAPAGGATVLFSASGRVMTAKDLKRF